MRPLRIFRVIRTRPRLFIAVALGLLVAWLLPHIWASREVTRWIIGWNCGVWLYVALTAWMMAHSDRARMLHRAQRQDEGARTILLLVALASLASLGAIVDELSVAKNLNGMTKVLHIALSLTTLASSWLFTQLMFALHYAHDFYGAVARQQPGGLIFPDTEHPDYFDFFYFSVVIGTSGQTADVSFASGPMRRVGTVHCVLAFVFNVSLIGLMINVASSLL